MIFGSNFFGVGIFGAETDIVFLKIPSYIVALLEDPKFVQTEQQFRQTRVRANIRVSSVSTTNKGTINIQSSVDQVHADSGNKDITVTDTEEFVHVRTSPSKSLNVSSPNYSVKYNNAKRINISVT